MNWQSSDEKCIKCGNSGFVGQEFCPHCGNISTGSEVTTHRSVMDKPTKIEPLPSDPYHTPPDNQFDDSTNHYRALVYQSGAVVTPPQPPAIQKKKRLTRNKIIIIIIACVFILISITASGMGYQQNQKQTQMKVSATATAHAIDYNPYAPEETSTLDINESLKGNSTHWETSYDKDHVSARCSTGLDGFQTTATVGNYFSCPTIGATTYKNLTFEVHMKIEGDCAGIFIRGNNTEHVDGYLAMFCTYGRYALVLDQIQDNTPKETVIDQGSMEIPAESTIAISMKGQHIEVFINKKKIIDKDDNNNPSRGKVGFVTAGINNPTIATFTNAKLWTLPE